MIEMPAGMELLTSNQRGHWGKGYRIGQDITDAVILLARAQKIPRLDRVTIVAEWRPPTRGRSVVRDAHNLAPSVKAAIDGITRAGVLVDDSDRYVADVAIRSGDACPLGRLVLIITEVPASASAAPVSLSEKERARDH